MTNGEVLNEAEASVTQHGHIRLSEQTLNALTAACVFALRDRYGSRVLMRLPDQEVAFFVWMRQEDPASWTDLWGGEEEPYLVSLAHLEDLVGESRTRGFMIRDLIGVDNFFFSPNLLIEKESDAFIGAVRERFSANQSLTPAQLLALEASLGPIDIWHFAYRHQIPLDTAKRAVAQLVDDRILLHVPRADHLVQYFDVQ
jgi:hypothetical protein